VVLKLAAVNDEIRADGRVRDGGCSIAIDVHHLNASPIGASTTACVERNLRAPPPVSGAVRPAGSANEPSRRSRSIRQHDLDAAVGQCLVHDELRQNSNADTGGQRRQHGVAIVHPERSAGRTVAASPAALLKCQVSPGVEM
jgi:hypothetical protein